MKKLRFTLQQIFLFFGKYLKNKYAVTCIVCLVLVVWPTNEIGTRWGNSRKISSLQKEISYYEEKIESSKQTIRDLTSNDENLERFARENYLMKRNNEDIFIIDEE